MRNCNHKKYLNIIHILLITLPPFSMANESTDCEKMANPKWLIQEKWAWSNFCIGREADFSALQSYNKENEDMHIVNNTFLEQILKDDKLKNEINNKGIRIKNAVFNNQVNLDSITYPNIIQISDSTLKGGLHAQDISIQGLSLAGSTIKRTLNIARSNIEHYLDISTDHVTTLEKPDLHEIKVQGPVKINRVKITGYLELYNSEIGKDLLITNSTIDGIDLTDASINKEFSLTNSTITKGLYMRNSSIGDSITLHDTDLSKSKENQFTNLTTGKDFIISESKLSDINLTGAKIGKTLTLGATNTTQKRQKPNYWMPGSSLILLNASTDGLADMPYEDEDSFKSCNNLVWPCHFVLDGFTYNNLSTSSTERQNLLGNRSAEWWTHWLKRNIHFSPQPYQQLESLLLKNNQPDNAATIKWDSKYQELKEDARTGNVIGSMKNIFELLFIGYGIGSWFLLFPTIWALLFTLLGAKILSTSTSKYNLPKFPLAYSFDMLIPIIRLNESHYRIELNGLEKNYFYFHKLFGYILAAFIASGFSDLLK